MSFTDAEKEKLYGLVKQHLRSTVFEKNIAWDVIAIQMGDGFTDRDCQKNYEIYKKQHQNRPFTKEEDELLLSKVDELGKQWRLISYFFIDRKPKSVRQRYATLKIRRPKRDEPEFHRDPTQIIPTLPKQIMVSDFTEPSEQITDSSDEELNSSNSEHPLVSKYTCKFH